MKLHDFEEMYGNVPVRKNKPYRRNMSPLTTDGWIAVTFLTLMAILLLFAIGTATVFNPEAAAIMAAQADMQLKIEELQEEQAAMMIEINQTELVPAATVTAPEGWMDFKITAYCACMRCCGKTDGVTASGKLVRENFTVAADWSVLPNGTVIEIEGVGIRTVEDNGVIGQQIDMYISDHQAALDWGIQYLRVRVVR